MAARKNGIDWSFLANIGKRKRHIVVTASNYGIDWLTGTSRNEGVGWKWYEVIKREKERLISEGYQAYGYSRYGYNGFSIGGKVWAYNQRWGYLVQVSGNEATSLYSEVAQPLSRFTRLDLQVTIECDPPEPGYIRQVYLANRDSTMPQFTYWEQGQGETCYVGSRVSERFGRVYDKGIQSGMTDVKGRYIRYEVEVKGSVAHRFESAMGLSGAIAQGKDYAKDKISSFVRDYFTQRGVDVLYNALPSVPVEIGRSVSTAETKLAWISSSVRQSIQFLIDAGYSDRLVEAFGLTEAQAEELAKAVTEYKQMTLPGLELTGGGDLVDENILL